MPYDRTHPDWPGDDRVARAELAYDALAVMAGKSVACGYVLPDAVLTGTAWLHDSYGPVMLLAVDGAQAYVQTILRIEGVDLDKLRGWRWSSLGTREDWRHTALRGSGVGDDFDIVEEALKTVV